MLSWLAYFEHSTMLASMPYKSLIGSLLYACHTRPDVCYHVNMLAGYMANPGIKHWDAAIQVLEYLVSISNLCLNYDGNLKNTLDVYHHLNKNPKSFIGTLHGYVDSDWGSDPDTMRSTTGYCMMLCGGAISWSSKKQPTVALSSTEAEFMAASSCVQDVLHIRMLLDELGFDIDAPTPIYEDNNGCIYMSKNQGKHKRAKHIDMRYHFIRDAVDAGVVILEYVKTSLQVADALTKSLGGKAFELCRNAMLGLASP